MTGRVQVETDDVRRLGLEVGVGGGHVAGEPMGPQVGLAPNALHDVLAHAEVDCEAAAGPVGRPVRRWASRGGQHPGAHPRRQLPRLPASVLARQAFHAMIQEPAAATTWRSSDETRQAWSPRFVRKHYRRGATIFARRPVIRSVSGLRRGGCGTLAPVMRRGLGSFAHLSTAPDPDTDRKNGQWETNAREHVPTGLDPQKKRR